jgi:RNA polymerase sigma-70 factor (ECF subfamily)
MDTEFSSRTALSCIQLPGPTPSTFKSLGACLHLSGSSRAIRCEYVCGDARGGVTGGHGDLEVQPEIVELARTGDREAFAALVRQYQHALAGYLFRLTGDRDAALDLTQETFVRAYSAVRGTRRNLSVRPWLFRIATNLAYDALRRQKRVEWVPLSSAEHRVGVESIAGVEEREIVRLALAMLRPDERAILMLCAVEQLKYEDVARMFRSTPDAIRKRFSRAKAHFRVVYSKLTSTTG